MLSAFLLQKNEVRNIPNGTNLERIPWGTTQNDVEGMDFASPYTVHPIVQTVRNLGPAGVRQSLPLWAPDGTNCTRGTVAIPMMGTPYQGITSIKHLGQVADELGDSFVPDDAKYAWQPADLEVWDGGEYAIMRTENGGRIQVGSSVNGVHETDNPDELFDYTGRSPDYVVRLGNYNPNYDPQIADKQIMDLYQSYKNMERYRTAPYLDGTLKTVRNPNYNKTVQDRVEKAYNENYPEFKDDISPYKRESIMAGIKNRRLNYEPELMVD